MSDKKPLSIQEMIEKLNNDKSQKKINEQLEKLELEKKYEAQKKYILENRRIYETLSYNNSDIRTITGGRRSTEPTPPTPILTTFLGASTYGDFWRSDDSGIILPLVTNPESNPYTPNVLNVNELYDLSGTIFSTSFTPYEHSVFAYNTNDDYNYFIGYNGSDTVFSKMDGNGNITDISIMDGTDIHFTQLIYVGGLTSSTDFIFMYGSDIYEIDTLGNITGPNVNYITPNIPGTTNLSSLVIVDGEYYVFFADDDYEDLPVLNIAKYDPSTGNISGVSSVTMNSVPSEILSTLKVVDCVASTSDFGFPSTTGNKIYANLMLMNIGFGEHYYFIVEMDTNGDSEYITNGDYVYDLSYYKKLV